MARAEKSQAVATIPRYGGRNHPLCAVYSRRLLEGLRRSLATGDCKVMIALHEAAAPLGEALDEFDVESVASALPPAEWPSHPPLANWFRNVNTPADYESLRAALEQKAAHPLKLKQTRQPNRVGNSPEPAY